jgi:hypothetical protein
MRDIPIPALILLQNLVTIAFVVMIAINESRANQMLLSVIAITYWLTFYVKIRDKQKEEIWRAAHARDK